MYPADAVTGFIDNCLSDRREINVPRRRAALDIQTGKIAIPADAWVLYS